MFLANCDLSVSWLPELEKIVAKYCLEVSQFTLTSKLSVCPCHAACLVVSRAFVACFQVLFIPSHCLLSLSFTGVVLL